MINLIYFSFFLFIWSFETKRFSLYYIQFYFDSAILCIGFWVWNWHFPFFKKLYGLAMETESHLFNPRHLTYTKNIRKICHIITPGHRKTLRVHSEISKKTAFGVLPYDLMPLVVNVVKSQISDPWSVVKMQCQGLPYGNWTHYLVIDNLHQCSNQLSYGDCSAFELPEVFGLNSQPETQKALKLDCWNTFNTFNWLIDV